MRGLIRAALASAGLGMVAIAVIARWPIAESRDLPAPDGDAYRGAYLARSAGCVACHTNTAAGGAALAGGKALTTPFGSFVPPNITTDPVHGIGDMTFAEFAAALRQGVRPDGKAYYPAFPYEFYADFSDQDIADLWAAIRTVPSIAEPAPAHDVRFPFNMRWGLKLWRAAYMKPADISPVLGKSDAWIRGQELVRGAAHCAACHTGRNIFGGLKDSEALAGSDSLPEGETAPSIRPEALKTNGWTVANLTYALKTSVMPNGDVFGGSMAEVVQTGTAFLDEGDREAIATYLLDPPEATRTASGAGASKNSAAVELAGDPVAETNEN